MASRRVVQLWPLTAFASTATTLTFLAANGGAYDVIVRQELGIVLWGLIAAGWLSGLLPRAPLTRSVRWAVGGLGLLAALTALSLTWTESAERTWAELARVLMYLGFVALIGSIVDRDSWRPVLAGCVAGGALVCALGMGCRLVPSLLPPERSSGVFNTTRLSYPLDYYNAMGAWGAVTGVLALVCSAHADRRATRAACLAVVPLAATVVFLTYSRAGIAGATLGLLIGIALARHRWTAAAHTLVAAASSVVAISVTRHYREIADGAGTRGAEVVAAVLIAGMLVCAVVASSPWLRRLDTVRAAPRLGRGVAAAVGAAVLIVILAAGPSQAERAWDAFDRPGEATPSDPVERLGTLSGNRSEIWASALDAFQANPLTGTGAGTFEFWFNRDGGETALKDAHSLLLEPLAELGVAGPLGVLVLLGALAAGGWRTRRRATTAAEAGAGAAAVTVVVVFWFQAGVDWIWECTAVTLLVLCVATTVCSAAARDRSPPALSRRLGIAAVALVAAAAMVPGLAAQRLLRESRAEARAGSMGRALSRADAAVAAQPWAASPYLQRALVLERTGRLRAASQDIAAAAMREDTNWRHAYTAARIHAELGDADAALADLERVQQLRPRSRFLPR